MSSPLIVLVLAVAVGAVTLGARGGLGGAALSRFRALFPAWRFFDRVTRAPQLWIRFAAAPATTLGEWLAVEAEPRGPLAWVIAPASNLRLAHDAAVAQLVDELGKLSESSLGGEPSTNPADDDGPEQDPQVLELPSFEIVRRIARAQVAARLGAHAHGVPFQWKIVVEDPAPTDYLLAPVSTL